ncbi:hypothetical protein AXF42_Ash019729 [Apostasia shenzhenica]|uniref:Uncharacterized protein n=1 Tax=Apostasia shenzhenica TaxID=1088818 RepID=A0A2H9ZRR8_9ASPA|nr:hypothetical protein AXF42_Ash019729 [Apostasia shenzhenica]
MARSFSTNPLAKTPIIGLFPPTTSSRHRRIDYRQSPQSPPAGDLHRILPYTCHRRVALQCSPGETAGEPRRHENHNREVYLFAYLTHLGGI